MTNIRIRTAGKYETPQADTAATMHVVTETSRGKLNKTSRLIGRPTVYWVRSKDHLLVDAVPLEQVLEEQEEHLPPDRLVAVHVGDVLELRLQQLVPPRVVRDLEHPQVSVLEAIV